MLKQNKTRSFFRLFILLMPLNSISATTMQKDIPLNMHIFPKQEPVVETLANNSVSATEPQLHMTIFTPDVQQVEEQAYVNNNDEFAFSYYLDSGYQNDSVNWSVSSPTGRPDTLTEVKWNDLSLIGVDLGFVISMPYNIVFKGDAGYAWTVAGNSTQTSFLRNGRTSPFSSINNDSDNGYAWHGSFALGYAIDFGNKSDSAVAFNFTPLAGYSWRKQNLTADNGSEQIPGFILSDPDTLGLENTYKASWSGPWLGADMSVLAFQQHKLFTSFQHHWADYEGDGNWRQSAALLQPNSFKHKADATGIVASAGYRYLSDELWGLKVSFDYQNWETDSGKEALFNSNSQQFNSRLNEVERESFGINIGVNMNF